MDQFGQNQFAPGMKSSLFVPDQLVVSTLQLVTDSGTITGGTFLRGTVLGKITASGKYTKSVTTATDGSQNPVAILVDNVDASTTDQNGGLYLMGEFNQNRIVYDDTWTVADLKSALRPLAIFLKDSLQAPVAAS
ncbi:head decoration protein [Klebsiella quasipneumoniae subsp. quasipneumoniae]|uniref:head decoration protein n=1 Tax=Klebsiella quasipneumoniae TaxID=1463165 RepID=UPI0022451896|nr:head decoration protein [Klebsiella quasipneumoniae]MCW9321847.1 head decoration protein [Klebsiella quasipneumoniae]MCW9335156.1 head decoration protein [Klebsiella quasipneumoniae]